MFVLVTEFSHSVNHFVWLTADVCRQLGFVCFGLECNLSFDCLNRMGVQIVALGVLHGFGVVQSRLPIPGCS